MLHERLRLYGVFPCEPIECAEVEHSPSPLQKQDELKTRLLKNTRSKKPPEAGGGTIVGVGWSELDVSCPSRPITMSNSRILLLALFTTIIPHTYTYRSHFVRVLVASIIDFA